MFQALKEWNQKNHQWVFSGVGVLLLSLLLTLCRVNTIQQVETSGSSVKRPSVGDLSYVEIVRTIRATPDLAQEDVGKRYLGLVIDWELPLDFLVKRPPNNIVASFLAEGEGVRLAHVICTTTLEEHPELKLMPRGSTFRVRGVISAATAYSLTVEPTALILISRAATAAPSPFMTPPQLE